MTAHSLVALVLAFSGLVGMGVCGSMHTTTFLSMAEPSVASDQYQPGYQQQKRLASKISGRAQPSADRADGIMLKRSLQGANGLLFGRIKIYIILSYY